MKATVLRVYMLTALGLSLFLLLALSLFEALPIMSGNNDLIICQQANYQLARVEFIIKDVYSLEYRGDAVRAQAVGELQIVEPQFVHVQNGLLNGDPALGLPPNPSASVKESLASAQSDFLAIDTALKVILKSPDKPPDPLQVSIIAIHERPYLTAMVPVATSLQQEAQTHVYQLMFLKMGLIALVFLIILLKFTLFTNRVIAEKIKEEAKED